MTVLGIIFTIAANAALTFLAGHAFVAMRRLQKDVEGMRHSVMMTLTLTMASHVKENFEELNRMKEEFNRLVEAEQHEEAQRLQGVIEKAAHAAKESLAKFNEVCGDNIAEIIVTKVRNGYVENRED